MVDLGRGGEEWATEQHRGADARHLRENLSVCGLKKRTVVLVVFKKAAMGCTWPHQPHQPHQPHRDSLRGYISVVCRWVGVGVILILGGLGAHVHCVL